MASVRALRRSWRSIGDRSLGSLTHPLGLPGRPVHRGRAALSGSAESAAEARQPHEPAAPAMREFSLADLVAQVSSGLQLVPGWWGYGLLQIETGRAIRPFAALEVAQRHTAEIVLALHGRESPIRAGCWSKPSQSTRRLRLAPAPQRSAGLAAQGLPHRDSGDRPGISLAEGDLRGARRSRQVPESRSRPTSSPVQHRSSAGGRRC